MSIPQARRRPGIARYGRSPAKWRKPTDSRRPYLKSETPSTSGSSELSGITWHQRASVAPISPGDAYKLPLTTDRKLTELT